MKKKKVLFYCQHVLGMGHLIRSREIVHGLKDFEVCFLNGGEIVPGFEFSSEISVVNLPPIKSDAEFKEIQGAGGFQSLKALKAARTKEILAEYTRFKPDALIIELFPFGRRKFAFELVPLLCRIQLDGNRTKVVCSLRDILVSKRDQTRHEDQVCYMMNRYFDLLLIHSDPKFQKLDETYSRMNDLENQIRYTGFVANSVSKRETDQEDKVLIEPSETPLILSSIGGGRVGIELLECAIAASSIVEKSLPHRLLIFTGPYLSDDDFLNLQALVAGKQNITLKRYTTDFLSYMKIADLSISMAGYNTCMNILTTETKAIVLPFTGNNNEEQTIRAEKLEALGLVSMIRPDTLNPLTLSEKILKSLKSTSVAMPLNLNGAENTAIFLKEMFVDAGQNKTNRNGSKYCGGDMQYEVLKSKLRPCLEKFAKETKEVRIFLRDDDANDDLEKLRQLFDVTLASGVPLNLEIIPDDLTEAGIRLLRNHKHLHPTLVELNQHGWRHVNHETEGRKCEFGVSRTFEQQLEDISKGKSRLEKIFNSKFYPVFTPPWNRCTEETLKALDHLGFKVFSKDKGKNRA
ncbi:MAG: glycosyltransferase, partial [Nitrospiria bacterium]